MNDAPAQISALKTVTLRLTDKITKLEIEISAKRKSPTQSELPALLSQETALTNLLASFTNEKIELLKLLSTLAGRNIFTVAL
jgi:hypothetical protein